MILVLKSGSLVLFGTFEFYTLVRNRGVESINWDLLFFPLRSGLSADFGLDKQDPWKCLSKARTRQALLSMAISSISSLFRDVHFGHSCWALTYCTISAQRGAVYSLLFLLIWSSTQQKHSKKGRIYCGSQSEGTVYYIGEMAADGITSTGREQKMRNVCVQSLLSPSY